MQPIEILESIRQNIRKIIVGRTDTIDFLLTSLVAGGHVLLEENTFSQVLSQKHVTGIFQNPVYTGSSSI